ncbi:MAG: hypothetical protein M1365_13125 [Actinobacteria bacterium]|nr:hypothetical protein [Actinomycetota bacterium]
MLLRIIKETFLRRKKWIALVFVSVLLGALVISSLLTVYGDISSKMSHELRSFGANILVNSKSSKLELEVGGISYTPPATRVYLDERELTKIKTIFWRNNIVGFAPFLSVVVQTENQPVVLTGTWFEKTVNIPESAPKQFGEKLKSSNPEPTFTTGVKKIMPWWKLEGNWVSENDEQGAIVGTEIARRMNIKNLSC